MDQGRTRVTRLEVLLDEQTKLTEEYKEQLNISKLENNTLLQSNLELANKLTKANSIEKVVVIKKDIPDEF